MPPVISRRAPGKTGAKGIDQVEHSLAFFGHCDPEIHKHLRLFRHHIGGGATLDEAGVEGRASVVISPALDVRMWWASSWMALSPFSWCAPACDACPWAVI
jgi:hypothetical protein